MSGALSNTEDFGWEIKRFGTYLINAGGQGRAFTVNGNMHVSGTISKGGTLKTDHPLDPLNKNIQYGFTEGARYYLVHIGEEQLVNGRATIDIDAEFELAPGTFAAMNQNAYVTSLNHQGSFDRVISLPIVGGVFEIICENEASTGKVVWTVIGERADAFVRNIDPNCERGTGRFIPQFDKPDYVEPEHA
ncbi:hypothetical protein G3A39_38875 [Paraburkholderia aspalathi]|nr:hypothetical protein [Paraburkholderia aspalathi]